MKEWKIITFEGTGVHIDTKKKTIMHNRKKTWIRFERSDLLHIYLHVADCSFKKKRSKILNEQSERGSLKVIGHSLS